MIVCLVALPMFAAAEPCILRYVISKNVIMLTIFGFFQKGELRLRVFHACGEKTREACQKQASRAVENCVDCV